MRLVLLFRRYVSPAASELFGFSPEQLTGETFTHLVHSEDLSAVRQLIFDLSEGSTTAPVAYRSLKTDHSYRWIEASGRLMLDGETGAPSGLVCVLRDIADRKNAEDQLLVAFRHAEKLAMMDGLTGVSNRRLLDHTLNVEWEQGQREETTLSFILIDVDHFKSYNDLHGHLAGDECLRQVALSLQSSLLREVDLLARYGGEEFAVVLPRTSLRAAGIISERLRKAVEDLQLPHSGASPGIVTVSLGVAAFVPAAGEDMSNLIQAADAALYHAKANGRNQTQSATRLVLS